MSEYFFLDTNIFLYQFDPNAPRKAAIATSLVRDGIESRLGTISFQVIQEFFNGAFKRVTRPFTPAEGQTYLNNVLYPLLAVHSSVSLYKETLNLYAGGGLSWYDSLIVAAAIQAECTILYSEDLQHGRKFGNLKIVNPFL